jgi:hypothetical protein
MLYLLAEMPDEIVTPLGLKLIWQQQWAITEVSNHATPNLTC